MLKEFHHSASAGCRDKLKMVFFIFSLLVFGLSRELFCAAEARATEKETKMNLTNFSEENANTSTSLQKGSLDFSSDTEPKSKSSNRLSRAVLHSKSIDTSSENTPKTDDTFDYVLKIPLHILRLKEFYHLLRPIRKEDLQENNYYEKRNTIIPTMRFGRSKERNLLETKDADISKKSETAIPMLRFGRSINDNQENYNNNVIPYPRLGRSDEFDNDNKDNFMKQRNGEDYENKIEEGNSYDELYDLFEEISDSDQISKRGVEEYHTMIPYPRPGRASFKQNSLHEKTKKSDPDYIVPQIRYGRSMLLLNPPKTEETTKQKPMQTFVLPYPRPGRSNKNTKVDKSENGFLILPYPRPGRSEIFEDISENKKSEGFMIPTARFGRNAIESLLENGNYKMSNEEGFIGMKFNPFSMKSDQKNFSEKPMEKSESNSVFVIPYPRPGKKSMLKVKNKQRNSNKDVTDYVLPYPRPGKKLEKLYLRNKKLEAEDTIFQENIPYSNSLMSDETETDKDNDINNVIETEYPFKTSNKKSTNNYMVPTARLGKRFDGILPYPRPGRFIEKDSDSNLVEDGTYFNMGGSNFEFALPEENSYDSDDVKYINLRYKRSTGVIPYPRFGRSNTNEETSRFRRSNSVVPYPRIGRSTAIVPYPRPGRSNSVVPYPRLGRSNTVVPYPRIGRSVSVVPYPRPGRSDSVVPYPRLGRKDSMVPYPRPGRSDSVVPYPRLGRTDSMVPYPRPGRSDSVVPYPKLGRTDSMVPYPRPGRSDSVVPYPRSGRKDSIVPYPRPGRSGSVVPYPRPGRSTSVIPYPRPGRSSSDKSKSSNKSSRIENWLLPNIRPGRSNVEDDLGNGNVIPYSRHNRSTPSHIYILPQPRFGRSESQESNQENASYSNANLNTLLPNIRFGRSEKEVTTSSDSSSSHKLNKHMIANREDSIYLLPYPRPGRYSFLESE